MINRLQNATSKVTTPTLYANHVRARIETMIFFKEQFMEKKNRRRWAFDSYKQEQGAIHKLVHTLLDGVKDKTNVVVAWGDGSFGPTLRGHASAPNKGLMERIHEVHCMREVSSSCFG